MKISSASKKVLASALSAAMVVAFAPTVAFGAVQNVGTTKVSVTYDAGSGAVNTGYSGFGTVETQLKSDVVSGVTKYYIEPAFRNGSDTAPTAEATYAKGAYGFAAWGFDFNGDGDFEDDNEKATAAGQYIQIPEGATSVTLTAIYNEPVAASDDFAFGINDSGVQTAPGDSVTFKVSNLKTTDNFTASLVNPAGKTIYSCDATVTGANAATAGFVMAKAEGVKGTDLTAGAYTLKVFKGGSEVYAKTLNVYTLTLDCGSYGAFSTGSTKTFKVSEGTQIKGLNTAVMANQPTDESQAAATGSGFAFQNWALNGTAVSALADTVVMKADTTLTAVYNNPQISTALAYDSVNKKLTASYNYLATTNLEKVTFAINGAAAGEAEATKGTSGTVTFKFGQKAEGQTAVGEYSTKAEPAAGTYTLTVTAKYKASANKADVVLTSEVALAPVTFDINGGTWADSDESKAAQAALISVEQVGASMTTIKTKAEAAEAYITAANSATDAIDYITYNGKKWGELTTAEQQKVPASGVAVKVVYKTGKVALPTYTQTTAADGKVTLTFTPADGTKLSYGTSANGTAYTAKGNLAGAVTVDPTAVKSIKVTAADTATTNPKASADLEVFVYDFTVAGQTVLFSTFKNIAKEKTSQYTALAPKYFGDDAAVKAAVEAGEAAVKAVGYGTKAQINAANLKAAQDLLKAIAGVEIANLDALKAGVTQTDGTVKKIGDEVYANSVKAIEKVLSDFAKNKDYKADGTTPDTTTASTTNYGINNTAYTDAIVAAYTAAKNAATTYAKADVDAAAAVTAQLKDPKTAAAGLEAYAALTAAQKELVAAADVITAQEIVAAAELKDAQDEAAVAKTRNASKTVKAGKSGKTTKKQSITLKKITSKSGAKVTYKKTSGKKAITVKSGKAYLAKGVKKGTYKATVKATCGTQTAKITVKFVVK